MSINLEKHRRMELRKATGTRVISPPKPVSFHRGPEYLVAHACFNCRKSYKRPVEYSDKEPTPCHSCPDCGECMHEMGVASRLRRQVIRGSGVRYKFCSLLASGSLAAVPMRVRGCPLS